VILLMTLISNIRSYPSDSTSGHMVKDVKRCFAEMMVLNVRSSSVYVGLFEGP